jgi:hypothetical protein
VRASQPSWALHSITNKLPAMQVTSHHSSSPTTSSQFALAFKQHASDHTSNHATSDHRDSDGTPPIAGSRRTCSASSASEDTPPSKAQKVVENEATSSGRRSKPKVADFDEESQSTILLACRYYRVLISTEKAFPIKLERDRFTRQAWQIACQE